MSEGFPEVTGFTLEENSVWDAPLGELQDGQNVRVNDSEAVPEKPTFPVFLCLNINHKKQFENYKTNKYFKV